MSERALAATRSAFERIMADPTPADLWQLQQALLVVGGGPAGAARTVARSFHACLRALESKSASRAASRWGALLGTAAVGSVSVSELRAHQEDALANLVQSGVPAMLEIGASLKTAQAWEVEAGLIYDDFAWFLYDELWDIAAVARPELSPAARGEQIDLVVAPLLDPAVPDGDRATLAVNVYRAVLAARLLPLLERSPEVRSTAGPETGADRAGQG